MEARPSGIQPGIPRVFPHPFGQADDKLFHTRILVSPIGDRLTLDFSKALITHEQLGMDEFPDYLSISFSAVDAVNHRRSISEKN